MKTLFKVLFIITFPFRNHCFSQTAYTIPWAVQQPKFVFPIFIEEGGGQKDTLYLGYDPNASQISFDVASQNFGVVTTHIDTNLFYAMWDEGGGFYCGVDTLCTDVYKANVCSLTPWGTFPTSNSIICNKGVMPLKFSWDNTVFYSDSLPYPNNSPAPRGWGRITGTQFPWCASRENFVNVVDLGGFYIVSDTPHYQGFFIDSVTFYNVNSQTEPVNTSYVGFQIEAWNSPTNINFISSENYFRISSLENNITITCLKEEITVSVYDLVGREILSGQIKANEFFIIPSLKPNLYFLVVNNQHIKKTLKIILHEN